MRSTGRVRSGRKLGAVTTRGRPDLTRQPRRTRIWTMAAGSSSVAKSWLVRSTQSGIWRRWPGRGYTSRGWGATAPPATSAIRRAARSAACTGESQSAPRSKRMAASVKNPRRDRASRTRAGVKYALSSRMSVVAADTWEWAPPITPASAWGRVPSAMTSISSSSGHRVPSRASKVSPECARRTMMRRWSRVCRSKACRGCPNSRST